jgi:transposase
MLALVAVIMVYRGQYLIERCFGRFKGQALSLEPLFLQTERRVEGLIRLLSLVLRLLILVEFVVRRSSGSRHRASLRGIPCPRQLSNLFNRSTFS